MANTASAQVPQCDQLRTVRKVLSAICREPGTPDQLSERIGISYRQVGYALSAINIMNFATRADTGDWTPTADGTAIDATAPESPDEKALFRVAIQSTEFGKVTAELWKLPPIFPPKEVLLKRLRESFNLSASTTSRRVSTLVSWARYLSQTSTQASLPLPLPDPKAYEQGFDEKSYPAAVKHLFELNSYDVISPYKVRGSEIDLKAVSRTEPFAQPIYIEATVQYVDNTKFGKDLTKLVQVREDDPGCKCVITSSNGFTDDVRERAPGARIETYTWAELRAKFERFDDYLNTLVARQDLVDLDRVYEEPYLDDEHGTDMATAWCTALAHAIDVQRWVIISGEYGTGKTALTKVLEYRWAKAHMQDPALPIPFRIELRNFSHQFNARTLVYHFLDSHNLTHLSVDFVFSLIHAGRIVLLLDGYDEMAQHMHLRERRACLEALAAISAEGARGIITSRPNYFSESEELQLFELLYRDFEFASPLVRRSYVDFTKKIKEIDKLLEDHFLERKERSLRDLTAEQTEALVRRSLAKDAEGQRVILRMLQNVFRASAGAGRYSLGGKPVIVAYLLEIIDDLKEDELRENDDRVLTEWSVYTLIVEKLMVRDYQQRTTVISPSRRREFLELLAAKLSQSTEGGIHESDFRDLIRDVFRNEMAKFFADVREAEIERYFADLRSSSTLTASDDGTSRAWRFSHNSLREFLACNRLVVRMQQGLGPDVDHPITDAMKSFVASKTREELLQLAVEFKKCRRDSASDGSIGRYLELLHAAMYRLGAPEGDAAGGALRMLSGAQPDIAGLTVSRIEFAKRASKSDLCDLRASDVVLSDCAFVDAELSRASFDGSILENVDFQGANLESASFRSAVLIDVNFSGSNIAGACFEMSGHDDISIVYEGKGGSPHGSTLTGLVALGFLASKGAHVGEDVDVRYVLMHDDRYLIFEKICRKLMEQGQRQRRGLEQRGAAQRNQVFGRTAVEFLIREGVIEESKSRREELVSPTAAGREMIQQFVEGRAMPTQFRDFLLQEIQSE